MKFPAEECGAFSERGTGAILRTEGKGLDLVHSYPFSFALLSLIVFLGAIVKMAYLAFNPNVKYWMGEWVAYAAFLPLLCIFGSYLINRIGGQPSKFAALLGLLGPSVLLFIGGYKVAITALTLSTAFSSTDCITNSQMYNLGQDYKAAVDFKAACKPLAGTNSTPTTINECAGYDAAFEKNKGWQYLAKLEQTSGCGGWCEAATTLWVYPGGVQDPCSSVAGDALKQEVLYPSMQVAIYDIVVLFLATVGIAVAAPKAAAATEQGLSWD